MPLKKFEMSCLVSYSDSSDSDEVDQIQRSEDCDCVKSVGEGKEEMHNNIIVPKPKTRTAEQLFCPNTNTNTNYGANEFDVGSDTVCDYNSPNKKLKVNDGKEFILHHAENCTKSCDGNTKKQLSLPSAIQSMFTNNDKGMRQWTDDPTQHGNRTRSFPHVEGNWATHVFIPVKKDEKLICFVNQLLLLFEPFEFEVLPEFHISLSRTVAIRHHWIQPLVAELRGSLSSTKSCVGDIDNIKFYSNDDKSRTFLCLEVAKEDTIFDEYVSIVDKCFTEFKLPKYYEEPSFHISVAWCLGDVCDSVPEGKLKKAKEILGSFCAANPELSVVFAQNICCRSGNKSFVIPLIV